MVSPTPPPKPSAPVPPHLHLNEVGALRALLTAIRTRIVSGLVLALPIVLTFWIIYWLYTTLTQAVLDPLAQSLGPLFHSPWAHRLVETVRQPADRDRPGPVLPLFPRLGRPVVGVAGDR